MIDRSWLMARIATPMNVLRRNHQVAAIAATATPKASSLELEKYMSPRLNPGSRTPRLRKSMPKITVASACRKNSTPPVTSSWLIGSAVSTGRMMKWCSGESQRRHQQHRRRECKPQGDALRHMQPPDGVHADHDQLGVADPDDVDDAEDEVEAERQQRQQAAEQQAVDDGFEQEDVEERIHAVQMPR